MTVINGTHVSIERGPYAPGDVMVALKRLGWAIPPGEQDAHELFHVLLTSLDEETPKLARMVRMICMQCRVSRSTIEKCI